MRILLPISLAAVALVLPATLHRAPYGSQARYAIAAALPPDTAESHFNKGRDLDAAGKLAEAEAEYREALKLEPKNPGYRLILTDVLLREGKKADALAEYPGSNLKANSGPAGPSRSSKPSGASGKSKPASGIGGKPTQPQPGTTGQGSTGRPGSGAGSPGAGTGGQAKTTTDSNGRVITSRPDTPLPPELTGGSPGQSLAGSLDLKRRFTREGWDLKESDLMFDIDDGDINLVVNPSVTGSLQGWSKGSLTGDFQILIEAPVEKWAKGQGEYEIAFRLSQTNSADAPAFILRRKSQPDGSESLEFGPTERLTTQASSHFNSDFVIRRRGSTFSVFDLDARTSKWKLVGEVQCKLSESLRIGMSVRKSGASPFKASLTVGAGAGLPVDRK